MIIHISGFPGSGKSTLGSKIKDIFKDKVFVYDTDYFIDDKVMNQLIKILNDVNKGKVSEKEYSKVWNNIISSKINEIEKNNKDKTIVFVGTLDNWGYNNEFHKIKADYKFLLNVKPEEIMKRYYYRLYYNDKNDTKEGTKKFWNDVLNGKQSIYGSNEFLSLYPYYMEWHKKNGYQFLTDTQIINKLKKII